MKLASLRSIPLVLAGVLACNNDTTQVPDTSTETADETGDGDPGDGDGDPGDGDGDPGDGDGDGDGDPLPIALAGAVQKGPLIIGSSVEVSPIDEMGSPTGEVFSTQTINDRGEFSLDSIPQGDIFIEGDGYYFNELTGEISDAPLTLRAYHRLDENSNVVVLNLCTHLTSKRILALLADGLAFTDAVAQSETELREALGIGVSTGQVDPMIELDLMGEPEFSNAYLLGVSAVFIEVAVGLAGGPDGPVDGELQQFINTLTLDMADGQLPLSTVTTLREAETSLNTALVEFNLSVRAMELGIDGPLPDINVVLDRDHDDIANIEDNCPYMSNADQADMDDDGVGDACDNCVDTMDTDDDGVENNCDNCPDDVNPAQDDGDQDGIGDTCDNCLFTSNFDQVDDDVDGIGDSCDDCIDPSDADDDGLADSCDNCPDDVNPMQEDLDNDEIGDSCDNCLMTSNLDQLDSDDDGSGDDCDNCIDVANPMQVDSDDNGLGDACDVPVEPSGFDGNPAQVKQFEFDWMPAIGADYYQLLESTDMGEPFLQAGGDVFGLTTSLTVPLHFRTNASYVLRACNDYGCTDSPELDVNGSLAEAIGYFKASNTETSDRFGWSVAISADGATLVAGAYAESSGAAGIGGNQADNSLEASGAVYVFGRNGQDVWTQRAYIKASNPGEVNVFGYRVSLAADGNTLAVGAPQEGNTQSGAAYVFVRNGQGVWSQQAYIKASNPNTEDFFGSAVALSADGTTLAVGAKAEDSDASSINGNQSDNSASEAGAVYVFERNGQAWPQQAYVKPYNVSSNDQFGSELALSGNGDTLAVGVWNEDSAGTGVGNDNAANLNNCPDAGAAYVFVRDGQGVWTQEEYIKASNTGCDDKFGSAVALSFDGDMLAVGAPEEDSAAMNQPNNNAKTNSGAIYMFTRNGQAWSQQLYLKAAASDMHDWFGIRTVLSADGNTLAVTAPNEASSAVGLNGDQSDNSLMFSGAVYVFTNDGQGMWSQKAYVKAPSSDGSDAFGMCLAISGDAGTLAISAYDEDSNATGISGDQNNNLAFSSGAVYVY